MNKTKNIVFEYIIFKLSQIYEKQKGNNFFNSNDFSKLKVIKLHFFVCSLNNELLDIFDKFTAMPYGPVEEDILNSINSNELEYYDIDNQRTNLKNASRVPDEKLFASIHGEQALNFRKVDVAIEKLKQINISLIYLSAGELVDISHRWSSWYIAFERARANQKRKEKISKSDIQNEPLKFYGPQ